jgi:hypothetical protein
MGILNFFDLRKYSADFDIFIETGTGKGLGVEYALKFNFKAIYSIEYVVSLYEEARKKFEKMQNVSILKGNSWEVFKLILPVLKTSKCVFWLDAHLPGVDYGLAELFDEKDPDVKAPLVKELETIKSMRKDQDIILIDDLRFYKKDEFENGNLEDKHMFNGYDRIVNMFSKSHYINEYLEDDGYLEMIPK